MTKLISDFASFALKSRLRRLSKSSKTTVKRLFGNTLKYTYNKKFTYQINTRAKDRKFRRTSQRGILLKMRRQILYIRWWSYSCKNVS